MASRATESRSRRYDPAETRTRVLEAANQLFSTKGFVNTGTADIARAADVSEGSIFYHFGSKRNLLAELGRRYGEHMIAAMHHPGEDLADLEPGITITRCFEFCETHRSWERIVSGDGDGCEASKMHGHPETEPFYHASREVVIGWITKQLQAVLARRGLGNIDVSIAASLTYAAAHDALDAAFAPGVTPEQRRAIRDETIRFIRAANNVTH